MSDPTEIEHLKAEIARLKEENQDLKNKYDYSSIVNTVLVPDELKPIFDEAEKNVKEYFKETILDPENAEILISGERYVLMRSSAISYEFVDVFKELYSNRGDEEAIRIANNFLFDIAHVLGKEDGKAFHKKMELKDPVQKLSAGPVHFAYTGWANVEILPESKPSPDNDYFIKYYHHNSFEAQSWIKAGRKSDHPVCTMNSGYSSGWCQESFGIPLTAVEIACEAQGAEKCTFIMAPPDRIEEYLDREEMVKDISDYDVPVFFQRKYTEDKLRESLLQKDTLLREVHHRVKNNLQVVSSLLNLQKESIADPELKELFNSSIMRVNTMAYIHEMIYGNHDLTSINIEKYFTKLLRSLGQFYGSDDQNINVDLSIDIGNLFFYPDTVIPLGLILNEIACNSFKYAFKDGGKFYLELKEEEGNYTLTVGDTGGGIANENKADSLGLSLIDVLCDQIDAKMEVSSSDEGLEYQFEFRN
ncbi:XylR N-terminal domain-containing protein [Crocinitomix catalasitica]|nr:XylR N-terminal domain-containing protein [Crocinitomix catalasitica]